MCISGRRNGHCSCFSPTNYGRHKPSRYLLRNGRPGARLGSVRRGCGPRRRCAGHRCNSSRSPCIRCSSCRRSRHCRHGSGIRRGSRWKPIRCRVSRPSCSPRCSGCWTAGGPERYCRYRVCGTRGNGRRRFHSGRFGRCFHCRRCHPSCFRNRRNGRGSHHQPRQVLGASPSCDLRRSVYRKCFRPDGHGRGTAYGIRCSDGPCWSR